jgi:outer membrane protein OmpA-like peptidoglycan-associated protein
MLLRLPMALLLGFLFSANVIAQDPPKTGTRKSSASRAKSIAGKLADTAVTSAAAMAADSVLGDNAAAVAAAVSPSGAYGMPACPEGLVPFHVAPTATASPLPAMPTPGSMIIGAAKKKMGGETADTAPPSASSGAQFQCGTAEQAAAAGNAGAGAPSAMSSVGAVMAATPQGMLVTGAIAAAPAAGKGLKKLGGMLGRGKQSSESMAKDLAKGRLQLKTIRFVDGSDELTPEYEPAIASLAEALQNSEGRFLLLMPAEANEEGLPDSALAQRRLTRVAMHLQLAGVPDDRLTMVDERTGERKAAKTAKRGDARIELVRLPAEPAP